MSTAGAADIATVVSAIVALIAVVVAIVEYFRRKAQDAESNRPFIVVNIESSEVAMNLFNVVINNIGKTAAKNIHISFSPNQKLNVGSRSNRINSLKVLKNLHFLPPNKQIMFFFGSYMDLRPETTIRRKYTITVRYDSVGGISYEDTIYSDPREMDGLTRVDIKTLHDGVKVLDKLSTEQQKLRKSQERIAETIVEKGIRIRNFPFSGNPMDDIRAVVHLYHTHSENEMWLNPFIYDFYTQIKRARDNLVREKSLTDKQGEMLTELNSILSIDTSDWGYKEDDLNYHFRQLSKLISE